MRSHSHRCIRSTASGHIVCLVAGMIFADVSVFSAEPLIDPASQSVLVMNNGRIISGRISQSAGGYVVRKRNGSVLVPFEQTRHHATDIQDAYRQLRESMPNPSATTRLVLARWCLTHQLYDETRAELRSALKVEPDRAEARNMLRRLEEILNPVGARHRALEQTARQTDDGFQPPEARALGGLPREAARQFITKVQPLLMNNCATAGCHDVRAENGYRLSRVRIATGGSRVLTERNLAATLRFVNTRDPGGSLLLTVPRGNHGRRGRTIFSGSRGAKQFNLLKSWVGKLAGNKNDSASGSRDRLAAGHPLRFNEKMEPAAGPSSPPQPMSFSAAPATSTVPAKGAAGGDPLLEAILREQRRDAFDPAEFNRQTPTPER